MALKAHTPHTEEFLDNAFDYDIEQRHGLEDSRRKRKKKKTKKDMRRSMTITAILAKAFGNKNKPQPPPQSSMDERRAQRSFAPNGGRSPARGPQIPGRGMEQSPSFTQQRPRGVTTRTVPVEQAAQGFLPRQRQDYSDLPEKDANLARTADTFNSRAEAYSARSGFGPQIKPKHKTSHESRVLIPQSHESEVARTVRDRTAASPEATTAALASVRHAPSLSPNEKRVARLKLSARKRMLDARLSRPLSGQEAAESRVGPHREIAPMSIGNPARRPEPGPKVPVTGNIGGTRGNQTLIDRLSAQDSAFAEQQRRTREGKMHSAMNADVRQWALANPKEVKGYIKQNPARALAAFSEGGPAFGKHRTLALREHKRQKLNPNQPVTGVEGLPAELAAKYGFVEDPDLAPKRARNPRTPRPGTPLLGMPAARVAELAPRGRKTPPTPDKTAVRAEAESAMGYDPEHARQTLPLGIKALKRQIAQKKKEIGPEAQKRTRKPKADAANKAIIYSLALKKALDSHPDEEYYEFKPSGDDVRNTAIRRSQKAASRAVSAKSPSAQRFWRGLVKYHQNLAASRVVNRHPVTVSD